MFIFIKFYDRNFITCEQDQKDREGGEEISHFRHLKWKKVNFTCTKHFSQAFSHFGKVFALFPFHFKRNYRFNCGRVAFCWKFQTWMIRTLWKIFCFHSAEIRFFMKEKNQKPKTNLSSLNVLWLERSLADFHLSDCPLLNDFTHITLDIFAGKIDKRISFVFLIFIFLSFWRICRIYT